MYKYTLNNITVNNGDTHKSKSYRKKSREFNRENQTANNHTQIMCLRFLFPYE